MESGNVISQQLKTKDGIWHRILKKGDVKWDPLWTNFKNFQPAWRHLPLKAFLIGVVVATFKLGLSGLDVGGDISVSYFFIYGDTYIYFLTNQTRELITSLNCSFWNETHLDSFGIQTPIYHCFVRNTFAGLVSLAFTMTPGLLSAYFVGQKLWKTSKTLYFVIFITLLPVQLVLFPVMIIVVKVSIFSELI